MQTFKGVAGLFDQMNVKKDLFLLTVDVEDWFQVEIFRPWIPYSSWSAHSLRVEKNTHRILDLLDSFVVNRDRPSVGNS